jgi:hypothetical protein
MVNEYHGQGGSYVLDPHTGELKLIERTEPAQPSSLEELTDAAPEPQTPDPGKNRKSLRNRQQSRRH